MSETTSATSKVATGVSQAASFLSDLSTIGSVINGLYSKETSVTVEKVETGVDIFEGERSYISLREFGLLRSFYQPAGEFYSRAIEFPEPVAQVALFVTQQIPDEWPVGNWIRYFLSTNQQSWTEVIPLSMAGKDKGNAFIVPGGSSSRLYLRAVFTRPEDDPYRSPLLLQYAVQGIIAEGTL